MNTDHGHHIPGTPHVGAKEQFNCGGVLRCIQCRMEAQKFTVHQPLADQIKAQWMVMEWVDAKFVDKFGPQVEKPHYIVNIDGFARFGDSWTALAITSLDDGYIFRLTHDAALGEYQIQVFESITSRTIIE